MHGPSPELGEQVALDSLVLDVLGGLGLGICRNHLVQPDDDGCAGLEPGSIVTSCGVLKRLPGALFHCWPSPRSMGSLTRVPVAAVNGLVQVNQSLNTIMPGGRSRKFSSG